jgi:NRAMP (natural resistance-associated macrophage protein)-like metal ion transporter
VAEPLPDPEASLAAPSASHIEAALALAEASDASGSQQKKGIRRILSVLGPGLVTGAAGDDPSAVGTFVQSGAQFGYAQLWTQLFILPFLTAVQEASGRVGAATGKGLAAVMRERFNLRLVYALVVLLLVANTITIGADIGFMASAAQLVIPLPFTILAITLTVVMAAQEIFIPYARYARLLKWLTISLLAYPLTVLVVHESWGTLLRATFLPHLVFSPAYLFIITAVLGTTLTPYMFFWEPSQEVEQERSEGLLNPSGRPRIDRSYIRNLRIDNASGMIASQFVSWCIIVVGASVLHAGGITTVTSAAEAAKALVPLVHGFPHAGTIAEVLFALGIVSLGLLACPVLAGASAYAVSEVAGWKEGLSLNVSQAQGFYGIIALGMLIGLLDNFAGINPIKMLVVASFINGAVAVPIIAALAVVARSRKVMGQYRSGWLSNTLVWLACLGMAAAAIGLVLSSL